jgi:hypothetical protein
MPIPNSGQISLNDDVNSTLQADTNETNVSLGDNNAVKFATVAEGSTITGRSMSELRGQSLFSIFPTSEDEGALGDSLHLDNPTSNNNYIKITDPGSTTADVFTSKKGTFSFWVKEHSEEHATDLTYYSSGTDSGNRIWLRKQTSSSSLDGIINVTINTGSYKSENIVIDKAGWYHHCVSIDTTRDNNYTKVRYWINGIELGWAQTASLTNNQLLSFGTNQRINELFYSSGYGMDATYADFKFIHGQALYPTNFGSLKYGIWIPKAYDKAKPDTNSALTTDHLLADYRFVNGSKLDETSNNNDLGTCTADFVQNNGGSIEFSGNDYALLPTSSPFNASDTIKGVSGWVKLLGSASSNDRVFMYSIGSTTSTYFLIGIYRTGPQAVSRVGGANRLSATINYDVDDAWHHYHVQWTGTDVEWYIDGEKYDKNGASNLTYWISQTGTSSTPQFGRFRVSSPGYSNGSIGELRYWDDLLTETEILNNYKATKHNYAYGYNGFHLRLGNTDQGSIVTSNLTGNYDAGDWDADGVDETSYSGSAWNDLSGNGNNASSTNTPAWSTTNGGYFDFDGANNFFNTGIPASPLNLLASVELWVNPDSLAGDLFGKRGNNNNKLFAANIESDGDLTLKIGSANNLSTSSQPLSGGTAKWHHIVFVGDSINSRQFIYVNGKLEASSFSTLTVDSNTLKTMYIGARNQGSSPTNLFNGKIAQFRYYDKILTPEEVAQNYTATQGHYNQLSLVDLSINAKKALAGGSALTGAAHSKSQPAENYANFTPHTAMASKFAITEAGTKLTSAVGGYHTTGSSIAPSSGKWYVEFKYLSSSAYGSARTGPAILADRSDINSYGGTTDDSWMWGSNGAIYHNNSNIAGSSVTATTNDIIGFAIDLDNHRWFISKNGSWQYSHDPATPSTGIDISGFTNYSIGFHAYDSNDIGKFYFGAEGFNYTVPSGYKAMSTANLPAITISPADQENPNDHFDVITYTGSPKETSIKPFNFSPDLVITKQLSKSGNHWAWMDSVRGFNNHINSSATSTQYDYSGHPNGNLAPAISEKDFIFPPTTHNGINEPDEEYVMYGFKGGGDAVSNTEGTITSQVSANTDAGFSVATYTGVGYPNASTAEVGHGLNSTPELVIIKGTGGTGQSGGAGSWTVGSSLLGNGWDGGMYINSSSAYYTAVNYFWNGAATSDVVKLKNDWFVNGVNNTYVMYSLHSVPGYSKIGTYKGNGNTNGPFVYTGFKPKFVLIKAVDQAGDWMVFDTARESSNTMSQRIDLNATDGEAPDTVFEFLSNGFKLITSSAAKNASTNNTYLYWAIAEDSFIYSQGTATSGLKAQEFLEADSSGNSLVPEEHFKINLWTGTGGKKFIETKLSPGLIWYKKRTNDTKHPRIFDSLRGAGNVIYPSKSDAEGTNSTELTNITSNGYQIGTAAGVNELNDTFVSWNWKAGDTVETKKPTYTDAGIYATNLQLHYNFANSNTYSGSGTTVTDISTNTNNGTLTNGAAFKDNAYGNYIDFDGSNDYISIPDNANLRASTSMTVEIWYKADSIPSSSFGEGIFSKKVASGAQDDWILGFWGSSYQFSIDSSNNLQAGAPQVGYWNHVVGTYDGTAMKLYENGLLIGTNSTTATPVTTTSAVSIGRWYSNISNNYMFDGQVGQARFYNAALTKDQVRSNYNATKTLYQGVGTTANVLQTNLALNYDFDDFNTFEKTWGSDNKAAVLNGSNGIIQSSIPKTVLNNNFSVSFWWKPNLMNTFQVPMGGLYDETGGVAYGWMVYQGSDNKMYLYWIISSSPNTSNYISNNVVLEQGKWYHVVATKTSSSASIHVNGSSASSSPSQGSQFNIVYNTNPTFYIGKRNVSNNYANGTIDQVRLFNKQVSSTEIKKLFSEKESQNNTLQILGDTSCVATYNFNGNYNDLSTNYNASQSNVTLSLDSAITSNRVTDKTSNNNSGYIYGGSTQKNNIGRYLSLDGTNDYVEGPSAGSIISSGATAVTIEGWVYMESHPSAFDGIIGAMNSTSPYGGWMIYNHHTADNFGFAVNVNGTWNSIDSGANIELNQWIHVAATYDGKVMKFYKNGKQTMYYEVTGSIAYPSGDINFRIGRNASAYADMRCAQARVYTSAITSSQVRANYNATKAQFFSPLIHSEVSLNDKAGFSIASYTGIGANENVAHGLSDDTEFTLVKRLDTTGNWFGWVKDVTSGNDKYMYLDFNYSLGGPAGTSVWNGGNFQNNIITLGTNTGTNANNGRYITYNWRSIPGYSKIGVYRGNGSNTQNVYTGFKPKFIMVKPTNQNYSWIMVDLERGMGPLDTSAQFLSADADAVESYFSSAINSTDTGFYLGGTSMNNSTAYEFIYIAFA